MFKTASILFIIFSSLNAQENRLNFQDFKSNSFSFNNSFSLTFFNDNLSFYSSSQSITSSVKIFGELFAGTAAGYGGAMLIQSMFKYNTREAELFNIIQLTLIALGAVYGNTAGVFLLGKVIGDEGSWSNTFLWSIIGSAAFFTTAKFLTGDNDKRIIAAAAGLPVGAVIGFNSNHLGEIISSFIYP